MVGRVGIQAVAGSIGAGPSKLFGFQTKAVPCPSVELEMNPIDLVLSTGFSVSPSTPNHCSL